MPGFVFGGYGKKKTRKKHLEKKLTDDKRTLILKPKSVNIPIKKPTPAVVFGAQPRRRLAALHAELALVCQTPDAHL